MTPGRRILSWLLPLFLLELGLAKAQVTTPDTMVKDVTEEVLTILRENKGIRADDPQEAVSLIENKVAPHFDFSRMTNLAVGRSWNQADPEQRKALTDAFRTLLVRTYANSLTAYKDQTVSFKPSTGATESGEVTVRSQINNPGSRPIPLDYSLAKSGDSWKVYDVSIAGVSLVTNYRSSFATELDKGGLNGLLKSLQDKNRRNQSANTPAT